MVTYLSNSTMKTDHGCSVEIYSGTNAFADCDHRTISLQATLYHVVSYRSEHCITTDAPSSDISRVSRNVPGRFQTIDLYMKSKHRIYQYKLDTMDVLSSSTKRFSMALTQFANGKLF